MAGDEEVELRDLVAHTLETSGVLGKIRAQLRASVFLALEEQESQQQSHPLVNAKFQQYLKTKDGQVATALVREFLNFFDLDYSCSVFDPETNALETYPGRDQLAKDLGLEVSTSTGPLLESILKRATSTAPAKPPSSASLTSASRQLHISSVDDPHPLPLASRLNPTTTEDPIPSIAASTTTSTTVSSNNPSSRFVDPSRTNVGATPLSDLPPLDSRKLPHSPTSGNKEESAKQPLGLNAHNTNGPLSGDLHPNVASLNSESRTGRDDDGEGKKDASGDSSISSHKLSSRDRGQISNGGDLSTDDLDSFFNTKPTQLNNLETRELGVVSGDKDSYQDDFDSDESISELLNKSQVKSSSKLEETEDVTLSQSSLTADFDYAEPAKT